MRDVSEHDQQIEPPAGTPDEQPFAHDGGPVGVVLSHGFTGTPASMRPWAEHLAAAGYSVRLPLLPGHGGTWQETNRTRWPGSTPRQPSAGPSTSTVPVNRIRRPDSWIDKPPATLRRPREDRRLA